jgi:uncharacterized protein involved in exopolysaccharide biosynthesis
MRNGPRRHENGSGTTPAEGSVITPFALARALLRRWQLVVALPVLTALVAAASALLFREYTARSRFVPQSARGDLGRLAGLAAQMGFSMGGDGPAESSDFYVDLVASGEVLRPAVLRELRFARRSGSADTLTGSWLDLLDIEGDTPDERVQNGIDALRENLSASPSVKSGVVSVRTTAPMPGLAEAINATILELLASFDRERRQAGAHAERMFVEQRLAAARQDLERAESALAGFLDRNRRAESPRLMIDLERLQRQVALRQQVYAALAQAYEQARIEEVRNTPVITIVDRPEGSARSRRGLVLVTGLGLLLGTVAALGLSFGLAWYEHRRDTPEVQELQQAFASLRRRAAAGSAS